MATTIKNSRHYDRIESLELTSEQEQELKRIWPLICRIAANYYVNDVLVSVDDLIQEAAVRVTRAIRELLVPDDVESIRDAYYSAIVRNTCTTIVYNNKYRYDRCLSYNILSDYTPDSRFDEDRIHTRLYVDTLLNSIKKSQNKSILLHYYGIDTQPRVFDDIASRVGSTWHNLAQRHGRTIATLKRKVTEGELPQWTTPN